MFLGLPDPELLVKGTAILAQILAKIKFLRLKIMCLGVSYKKKYQEKLFFCILKVAESGSGSGNGFKKGCGTSPTVLLN
jgi:hypothetical protein